MPPNRKKLLVSLDPDTAAAVASLASTAGVTESAWAYHAIRARALGVKFSPVPRPVGFAAASPESRESAGRAGGLKAAENAETVAQRVEKMAEARREKARLKAKAREERNAKTNGKKG